MTERKSVFEKIEYYKNILKPVTEGKSEAEIKLMLCHCKYYDIGRFKNLNSEERVLYDFLLKNKLRPKTLYENFMCIDYPEQIRKLLYEQKISMREASSRAYFCHKMIDAVQSKELMEEIKKIIRGLKWPELQHLLQTN